jgi:predicted DNA-binding protein (UPF0251 family)
MTGDTGPVRCCRSRGRPRITRLLREGLAPRCYAPQCCRNEGNEAVSLLSEEIELLKLVDLEGLEQEEAAAALGVSRKTAWRDLHEARKKVADALVNGKTIAIAGCRRRREGLCPRPDEGGGPENDSMPCPKLQPFAISAARDPQAASRP